MASPRPVLFCGSLYHVHIFASPNSFSHYLKCCVHCISLMHLKMLLHKYMWSVSFVISFISPSYPTLHFCRMDESFCFWCGILHKCPKNKKNLITSSLFFGKKISNLFLPGSSFDFSLGVMVLAIFHLLDIF
jgi:hypothetical protein